jgi:cardiolipin synthase
MIIPIDWLIIQGSYQLAFTLILIAGLSDGVDGYLARNYHWQTPSGALLDPLADKILLIGLFLVLGFKGLLPYWLIVLVISRDLIILAGAAMYQLVTRQLEIKPLFVSKINTATQIGLVALMAFHLAISPVSGWIIQMFIITVAVTTFVSGAIYVILWTSYAMKSG